MRDEEQNKSQLEKNKSRAEEVTQHKNKLFQKRRLDRKEHKRDKHNKCFKKNNG